MLQFGAGMDLNSACRVGNLEVVRTQLAKGEEGIRQAQRPSLLLMDALRLRYCVGQKDDAMKDIIALLLFHGAPVNPELTPLDVGAANLPLHEACSGAVPIEVVRLLLRYGADVTKKNVDGRTPLDIAELRKDQPLCDLLRAHVAECANNE
jgi:ankyrin repeat protein